MEHWDLVVRNGHVATMRAGGAPYGAIRDALVAVRGGRIGWIGPRDQFQTGSSWDQVVDARGGWVTPGLIDCHTHLVFGGNRVGEFEARLGGASYEELALAGGGILSTVAATRDRDEDQLLATARPRLDGLAAEGVTRLEIKSGYGLDTATELRMLRVARRLGEASGLRVRTTLLAAHALPPEFSGDRAGYLDLVCREMIPEAAASGLADQVDVFCEAIAFTAEECARVLRAGADHGLEGRVHADQRTDAGGAAMAAAAGARSADHLEHADTAGVRAMAAAGTAAVLLPGAAHFLDDPTVPPVEAFRAHGVPMAVATDLNPGSSPLRSPLLAMNMACARFGLTPEESLAGVTRIPARILGWEGEAGTIESGKDADLAIWDVESPAELSYWIGGASRPTVIVGGVVRQD